MKIVITVAAALGVLAAAPLSATLAADADGLTIDLSAQQQNPQQKPKVKPKPAPKAVPRAPAARNVQQGGNRNKANVNVNTRTRTITTTTKQNNNLTTTRTRNITTTNARPNNRPARQVTFSSNRQTFTGTRARGWHNTGNWNYRGRNYSYWRGGPYRHRYNGGWRTYVALGTLAAIAVGTATYYPYAYVSAPQEVCEGITEDGCQLTWTEAETLEGGVAPVCVTYCPWQ